MTSKLNKKPVKKKKKKKSLYTDDPFALKNINVNLHPNDVLSLRKILFANSLTVQNFFEHVVKQLVDNNPDALKFIEGAQKDKIKKSATYGVRYTKAYNSESEAELLYKLLAEK